MELDIKLLVSNLILVFVLSACQYATKISFTNFSGREITVSSSCLEKVLKDKAEISFKAPKEGSPWVKVTGLDSVFFYKIYGESDYFSPTGELIRAELVTNGTILIYRQGKSTTSMIEEIKPVSLKPSKPSDLVVKSFEKCKGN